MQYLNNVTPHLKIMMKLVMDVRYSKQIVKKIGIRLASFERQLRRAITLLNPL